MGRRVYLDYLPIDELERRWYEILEKQGFTGATRPEKVPVSQALGRVTTAPVLAPRSSPAFHASAVDGIAVRSQVTYGAMETAPKRLKEGPDAMMIDTGDPVPTDYDAVIMIEDVFEPEPGIYEIIKPVFPWENVRPFGEDMVRSELVLPRAHIIRSQDIGAMLASGMTEVSVCSRPRVGIIPTGTELAETPDRLEYGQVIESNSWVLRANVIEWGGEPVRWPLLVDDYALIRDAMVEAVETCDLVVVNAGTSAGREDFTAPLIEELGTLVGHGAAIRPGRTVIIGAIKGKPVMGFAGFPVANFHHSELFLKPLLYRLQGTFAPEREVIEGRTARKVVSTLGVSETIQVKVAEVAGEFLVAPLPRGSGVTMSLVRSDGEIHIGPESEGVHRGQAIQVSLKVDRKAVANNILAVGSHDIVLDQLDDELKIVFPEMGLASANVGSLGGLMAVKEGTTHIAGAHLLDDESGEYNLAFIDKYLGREGYKLLTLAYRTQGIFVAPGNPKGIREIMDLTGSDISFVNRQKEAGTRILLDYLMKANKIMPEQIKGYERELFTHTAVAAAVASGSADAALGIWAAADALGLDFIPVAEERYDLLMSAEFFRSLKGQRLIEAIRSDSFKTRLGELKGYDPRDTGREVL